MSCRRGACLLSLNCDEPSNPADGGHALFSNITGLANAVFGWYALFAPTEGSKNTAVGAGALDLNTGNNNTAVGMAALLLNTGGDNTAIGVAALESNRSAAITRPMDGKRSPTTPPAATTRPTVFKRCFATVLAFQKTRSVPSRSLLTRLVPSTRPWAQARSLATLMATGILSLAPRLC